MNKSWNAALTWHPADCNEIAVGSNNATLQVQYSFHGTASHAAGAPDKGRSALDAVELMNIGVQFLREHMPDRARVHYAITDAGGRSANVVQAHATVLYMTRSPHVGEAIALQERVDRIAEGAALMTDTTFERKFIDGTADLVPVHAFEALGHRVFSALGVPSYTAEEQAFGDALGKTCVGRDDAPGIGSAADEAYAAAALSQRRAAGHALNDFLLPLYAGDAFSPGSTDVGDVSQLTPALQFHVTAWPNGCPGHSWQNVSCGGTEIGRKAAFHAGKLIACTAIELFEDPALLEAIRDEWRAKAAQPPYVCPIPPEAVPTVAD